MLEIQLMDNGDRGGRLMTISMNGWEGKCMSQ
jgi:hypothetical protein